MNDLRTAGELRKAQTRSTVILKDAVVLLLLAAALGRLVWVLFGYYLDLGARRHHLESAWLLFAAVAFLIVIFRTARQVSAQPNQSGTSTRVGSLLAAVAASIILYWPSLSLGLLSDDYVLLTRGPLIEDWDFFRPLPLILWQVIDRAAGPAGLHLLNVVLHGLNAWLLSRLLTICGAGSGVSAIAGALFLTFPASVEAVAWSSGIFDVGLVCCALVYLTAVTEPRMSSRAIAAVALACGLLTKETAVSLPIMALALGLRTRVDRTMVIVSIAAAAAYGWTRLATGIDLPGPQGPLAYVLKELIARPFAALGVPWSTREVAAAPLLLAVGPQLAIGAFVAGYAGSRWVSRRAIVPVLWILAAVAPLYGLFLVGDDLSGSRYLYLPLVGWCVLAADLIQGQPVKWARALGKALVIVAVVAGAYGVRAHLRPWKSAAALRDSALQQAAGVIQQSGCAAINFLELPDNVDGAFVFRNGFSDALRKHYGVTPSGSAPPECTFVWSGTTFAAR